MKSIDYFKIELVKRGLSADGWDAPRGEGLPLAIVATFEKIDKEHGSLLQNIVSNEQEVINLKNAAMDLKNKLTGAEIKLVNKQNEIENLTEVIDNLKAKIAQLEILGT